jgi:hypothetical protein
MKAITEILKCLLFAVKFLAGMLAIVFLLGEEADGVNLSLLQFIGIKGGALLALYLLYKDFLLCGRHNLLPWLFMQDYRDIERDLLKSESDE